MHFPKSRIYSLGNNNFGAWDISPDSTLFRGHRYLNEKPFCPIRSSFPAILGFCSNFVHFWTKFSQIWLLSLCLLLYTKRPSRSMQQLVKKKKFWAEIVTKICFNTACQTNPTANTVFSKVIVMNHPMQQPTFLGSMLPQYMALSVSFVSL